MTAVGSKRRATPVRSLVGGRRLTGIAKRAPEISADGRVRRAQRSDQAIVEALLGLVGEGVLDPTAQQVAERARVGIRTVFRRFSDMESLFAEMDARIQAEALPLLLGQNPQGSVAERARSLVRLRAAFFERIVAYKRAGNLKRWRSPFLKGRHARLVGALRQELTRWLPEIRRASTEIADALDLATSFEAWDRLRGEQGLGSARAEKAMEAAVLALVAHLKG